MVYWNFAEQKKKKCIFGDNPTTNFACTTTDDQGICYAGGSNSLIYVWNGNNCKQTHSCHNQGFIGAIIWVDGQLYSGGKDGRVCVTDTSSMQCTNAIEFGVLPRAIDAYNGMLVVGLRSGSIVECNLDTQEQTTVMEGHNDGEVWGLDMANGQVITTGDDNQVKLWDPTSRKCVGTSIVNTA